MPAAAPATAASSPLHGVDLEYAHASNVDYSGLFHEYDSEECGLLSLYAVDQLMRDLRAMLTKRGRPLSGLLPSAEAAMAALIPGWPSLPNEVAKGVSLWHFKVNFWRLLEPAERQRPHVRIPPVLVVCDPGPDPDDVKVVITAARCHLNRDLDIRGFVCNGGHQAVERATLARCVLAQVDHGSSLASIPVCAGTAGQPYTPKDHESKDELWITIRF